MVIRATWEGRVDENVRESDWERARGRRRRKDILGGKWGEVLLCGWYILGWIVCERVGLGEVESDARLGRIARCGRGVGDVMALEEVCV